MLVPSLIGVIVICLIVIIYLIMYPTKTLSCPKVEIPEMKCPKIEIPEVKCPEVKCPEMKCPEVKCPEVKCPDPSTCTLTTYAFKHHFFKLLTGPRKAFAMKIIDVIHEVQTTTQNKYVIPLLEDTLDINLQLILEGVDWDFLNNIVDNTKECILTFLNTNTTTTNNVNGEIESCLRRTFESIKKENIYEIYLQIHKNLRKNYTNIKFVRYEKLPDKIKQQLSKEEFLDHMKTVRNKIKSVADEPFISETDFYTLPNRQLELVSFKLN